MPTCEKNDGEPNQIRIGTKDRNQRISSKISTTGSRDYITLVSVCTIPTLCVQNKSICTTFPSTSLCALKSNAVSMQAVPLTCSTERSRVAKVRPDGTRGSRAEMVTALAPYSKTPSSIMCLWHYWVEKENTTADGLSAFQHPRVQLTSLSLLLHLPRLPTCVHQQLVLGTSGK